MRRWDLQSKTSRASGLESGSNVLRGKGGVKQLISAADCLVAAPSLEQDLVLLHSDNDFEQIAKICKLETLR